MAYKVGDRIGRYIITRNFSRGGKGEWGFTSIHSDNDDSGEEFFIKQYIDPKYPGANFPSEILKKRNLERCRMFEEKHNQLKKAFSAYGEGGLIVKAVDFFRDNNEFASPYFKVCKKIDPALPTNEIHLLPPDYRLFVLLTAAFALKILHTQKIIHFDIKPDNILVQKYGDKFIAKLIDFDDSFIEGESLSPDSLVGDFAYYSPEVASYINRDFEFFLPGSSSDIFSLGLVFSQYWTGNLPFNSDRFTYAYEAINVGKLRLTYIDPIPLEQKIGQLIERMLVRDPKKRPSSEEVHYHLKLAYSSYIAKTSRNVTENNKNMHEAYHVEVASDSRERTSPSRVRTSKNLK
jgi:eukaryotic-like serine/threonine-protein kinase